MELKKSEVYSNLVPAPTDEDYQGLYESIKEEGLKVPIVVNQYNVILDGHHRYEICKELKKPIKTVEYKFDNSEDELNFVIDANLERRQMTTWARVELAYRLKSRYEEEAKEQQSIAGKTYGKGKTACVGIPTQPIDEDEKAKKEREKKTRTKVCKKVKISTDTFSYGNLPMNRRYDKTDEELDQEIQKIFTDYNIEIGKIKEGEKVNLFPDQLEILRDFIRPYQEELDKLRQKLKNKEIGIETANDHVKGWDSEIKLKITEQVPKTDLELMTEFGKKPRPYDVWNFPKLDTRFGKEYPGQIPADIVFQTLYFFTEQGNLVVDPMAGGAVTSDVCSVMNRKCIMYDISDEVIKNDERVQKHDIIKGLPKEAENADLVFWDPPYYKKLEKDYDALGSIATMTRSKYLQSFEKAAIDFHKKGVKKIALLMSNYRIMEDIDTGEKEKDSIWYHDYANLFLDTGKWQLINEIQCPLSTEQVQPQAHIKFVDEKKTARISRVLFIFERK